MWKLPILNGLTDLDQFYLKRNQLQEEEMEVNLV